MLVTEVFSFFVSLIESAIFTLVDYLSFHVLLCLIPAFIIAGAMTIFIPKEQIIKLVGKDASPYVAYPVASSIGFLLAVCSCTVLPLFAGIWKKGAGLGPALTFLFIAPAVNLLAITYTGTLIGLDVAFFRFGIAILIGILIGVVMARMFPNLTGNTQESDEKDDHVKLQINKSLIAQLIIFTLISFSLVVLDSNIVMSLTKISPYIVQTSIFMSGIFLLIYLSYRSKNHELILFLWLFYLLFTGTSQIKYFFNDIILFGITIDPNVSNMIVKILLSIFVFVGVSIYFIRNFDRDDFHDWKEETLTFTKQIFPLIIAGVLIVGVFRVIVPTNFLASYLGTNSVFSNSIAIIFGIFMYFPTLMEVPIAKLFLELGMAKGPLVAYLLADPELSVQSILVTKKYIGNRATSLFVILVFIFTLISGLLFGLIIGEGIILF